MNIFWHAQRRGFGHGVAFVVRARRLIQAIQDGELNYVQSLYIGCGIEAARQAAEISFWRSVSGQDPFWATAA
jgi:hypothetical protein